MKFCFFGYDHTLDILQRLINEGHEVLRAYTFKCDNYFSYNMNIKTFCEQNSIKLIEGKITEQDIASLIDQGCELFITCGYPYKVPPINESKAYGVNLHPTLLPRARGIMPQPYIIIEEPEAAGFTLHKMTQEYDAGDILFQKAIPIDKNTDIETLSARIAIHTPDVIAEVINNLEEYWNDATPQNHDNASYYDEPDDVFRTLDWNENVENLLQKNRAFGRYGVLASISNQFGETQDLAVFNFSGWKEDHARVPGTLIRSYPREITVAVKDGYICLKEFQAL